ncbi:MAG: tyrosine-type recombinase/integrase [Nitrospiraceae bacterium]
MECCGLQFVLQRLSREAKGTDLHFHDLRHTFATWLQNLGVSLEDAPRCWAID